MGSEYDAYGSAMGMSHSVFLPGPGSSRSFARNAILEVTRPTRGMDGRKQDAFSLKMMRPARAAMPPGSPARKGSLVLLPITLAVDTGLAKRLSSLLPAAAAPAEARRNPAPHLGRPLSPREAAASASDELTLELEMRCAKVTTRLHFIKAGSNDTPLAEYLELSPAVVAASGGEDGWQMKFRNWAPSADGTAGGYQLGGFVCEQRVDLCQNRGEPTLLCRLGGELRSASGVAIAPAKLRFELANPASKGRLKEVTITICGEGKLGLMFHKGRVPLEVTHVNPAGLAAQIDSDGDQITEGMTLLRVGDVHVPPSYEKAVQMVKEAHEAGGVDSPFDLTFLERSIPVPGIGRLSTVGARAEMAGQSDGAASAVVRLPFNDRPISDRSIIRSIGLSGSLFSDASGIRFVCCRAWHCRSLR